MPLAIIFAGLALQLSLNVFTLMDSLVIEVFIWYMSESKMGEFPRLFGLRIYELWYLPELPRLHTTPKGLENTYGEKTCKNESTPSKFHRTLNMMNNSCSLSSEKKKTKSWPIFQSKEKTRAHIAYSLGRQKDDVEQVWVRAPSPIMLSILPGTCCW